MRATLCTLTSSLLVLAACGGPPAPRGLAWGLPEAPSVTYLTGDTMVMDIDAGGEAMEASVRTSATLGVTFTRVEDGVSVAMTFQEFSGRLTQPMGGPVRADESGIRGPLLFTMDRRGGVTRVTQPELTGNARQFVSPLSMASTFFPRLPGRAAAVGESWTDTVRVEGEDGAGRVSGTTILNYTVVGDTLVAGRELVLVSMEGTAESSTAGLVADMDFTQNVRGDLEGWFLWDRDRGLVVEQRTRSDLRGEMDVTAAPFPLGVRVRGHSTLRLQDDGT